MKRLLLAALLVGQSALASVVEPLTPETLFLQSDAVVEGRVISVRSRWNADHTGLETDVQFDVATRISGITQDTITIVVQGGFLDGRRHIIVGMPSFFEGEEARLFLRRLEGPVMFPRYRVYGWEQGKWRLESDKRGPISTSPFTTNGMRWPSDKVPVQYKVSSVGSDDLSLDEIKTAVAAGFDTWARVPCSSLRFQYAGETTRGVAVDDENVILFLESGWVYGEEAAGATSLHVLEGMQTADIAMNGQRFRWAISPPTSVGAATTMDLQGVLTHEMGHFSGLNHTQSAYDTMYYSWKPWPGQRTISVDDKRGICSIYPVDADECSTDSDCPSDETCQMETHGRLCGGVGDPIGTPCNYDRVECADFCLFGAADLSSGACSKFCEFEEDCPVTHTCAPASAGTQTVKVCFFRPGGPRDAGIVLDASIDGEPDATVEGCGLCRRGSYCDEAAQRCTYDCLASVDCGAGKFCNDDGRCEAEPATDEPASCACLTSDAGSAVWLIALVVLLRRRVSARA